MSCYVCRIGPHGYIAREKGIRLHRCPKKNRRQRQKWLIFCCLPSNLPDDEANKLFLCTKHFDKDDVIQSGVRTLLRQNAAPCFFPPIGAQVSTLEELENANDCSTQKSLVAGDPLDNLLDIDNPPDIDLMRICKTESALHTKSPQS
ncbi:hypothetical protein DMN91_004213 [Ooceraea biroi]|uniref:THAP-type domain-containing protein n=1 Tax=Ooceraea biroi TaxID=2015173 RepID=A0A026X001_OOCBI|nr:uncharacterized protein LOC105285667 [Ooceraea biroi]EZA61605.1 hypothetical protein X777_07938 [Ooceraea biroi]RLU24005.1 hypothetical protein DMN91_004213 [Ooceraea biroi]